ncbi:SURF1 family cytochrome oxidase biogenesis protein [Microbacterium sp.]|uniref:SURF1 family cytochrome oxidase biogenesis protein n=1 Tax=Microbacterium sp. TaxID=51671 RepID=UPI003F7088AD
MSRRESAPAAVRWTAYVAVAIVFAIACAFLSNWQFTRNAARSAQLALVEANYDAPAVPLSDVLQADGALNPLDEWQPVELVGEYLSGDQLLVRNRPHGGTAAFEVLVPFRLDDGRIIVLNRGWVPPGRDQPDPDAVPGAPEGSITVVARVRPGEADPGGGRTADAGKVPNINLPIIAEAVSPEVAADLEQGAYGIVVSEDPAAASMPNALEAPTEDPGPHLSYAIQWILFAIMGFIFIGYVIRTELRHRREDAEDAAVGITTVRRPAASARRDRDAEDEDALLDAR